MTSHPERESGRTVDEACARAEGVGCPMCRSKDTYSFVSGGCRKCGEEWTDGLPVSAPVTQPVIPPAPAVSEVQEYNLELLNRAEAAESALAAANARIARLEQWTHEMGADLIPPGADTFGEGNGEPDTCHVSTGIAVELRDADRGER